MSWSVDILFAMICFTIILIAFGIGNKVLRDSQDEVRQIFGAGHFRNPTN